MKYFITGATGFIGGRLARQLVGQGHEVIALVRNAAKAKDLAEAGVKLAQGDITDKESMRAPMTGVDGVFHVAGWYEIGTRDKTAGQRINIDGTRNVLEMMRELKIPKGVYTSTIAVFSNTQGKLVDESYHFNGTHVSEYDRTKWVAHYEIADPMMKQGLPLVIVHPGLVYGPVDHSAVRTTLIQYLQRRLPVLPLESAYCWSHVDDTAHGHMLAMDKGKAGENYIIGGKHYTLIEAMQVAEKITGIPVPKLHISPALLKAMSALVAPFENFLPLPATYTSEGLRVTAGVTYIASDAKARRELGFDVRPLEEGLREVLQHEMKLLGMKL
jgi:nucleoside-diphosphate-sugar epimerase